MQLVAKSSISATREQSDALLATMECINAARSWIAAEAMTLAAKNRGSAFSLQKQFYAAAKAKFGLSAQMVVRAIADVARCFARDAEAVPVFRPHAAVSYDIRILRFYGDGTPDTVSITTLSGRLKGLPLVVGGPHRERLAGDRGASQLILRKGRWYLHTAVEIVSPKQLEPSSWLGVDLGIVNLAVDSDGEVYTGAAVDQARARRQRLSDALQARGTRSARRHLKRLSGREARFRRDVNHCISKRLVSKAEGTGRGIAMENLRGIRGRVTVTKAERSRHSSWAFLQLREFVSYKAEHRGVPVRAVDPRNTSRTCPVCGCCDKRNRPTRDTFCCVTCGHRGPADHVASINISNRAVVNQPIVLSDDRVKPHQREPRVAQGQAPCVGPVRFTARSCPARP